MSRQRKKHPMSVFREKHNMMIRKIDNCLGVKGTARNRRVEKLDQQLLEYEWAKEDEEIRYEVWEDAARQYRM